MNKKNIVLILLCFVFLFSCSTKQVKKPMTQKLPSYEEINKKRDLTYLEAKKIALDDVSLTNYNPFSICIECLRAEYRFYYYVKELDQIFIISINRKSFEAKKIDIKDNTYLFLREENLIDAEKALNTALNHASARINSGYTYAAWLDQYNTINVYRVIFGDDENEYQYMVNSDASDPSIMARDVIKREFADFK